LLALCHGLSLRRYLGIRLFLQLFFPIFDLRLLLSVSDPDIVYFLALFQEFFRFQDLVLQKLLLLLLQSLFLLLLPLELLDVLLTKLLDVEKLLFH